LTFDCDLTINKEATFMTRTATGFCLVMAIGLASLGAQTPQTATSAPGSAPASSVSDRENITVTGCLQKDASGSYVLTNAHVEKSKVGSTSSSTSGSTTSSSSATSGTTGTTGASSSSSSSMGVTFKLEGDSAELDKHVGHKIQVTGKESPSTTPSSSATSATATGTTGTTGSVTPESQRTKSETERARKLDVHSVKMISSSCP
jgi:hypothetical protein